jgi:hypothetical protein
MNANHQTTHINHNLTHNHHNNKYSRRHLLLITAIYHSCENVKQVNTFIKIWSFFHPTLLKLSQFQFITSSNTAPCEVIPAEAQA